MNNDGTSKSTEKEPLKYFSDPIDTSLEFRIERLERVVDQLLEAVRILADGIGKIGKAL